MADWTTLSPALGETISAAFANIRGNWDALASAWHGDHKVLTGDGTNSTAHEKVTLPERASKPDAVGTADTGYVYTKEDAVTNKTELFFEDEYGDEVQLTSGGQSNGSYKALCSYRYSTGAVDAATQVRSSVNIDTSSLVLTRSSSPTFQVDFTTPMSGTDYTVSVNASSLNGTFGYTLMRIEKATTYVKFYFVTARPFIVGGRSTWVSDLIKYIEKIDFTVYDV